MSLTDEERQSLHGRRAPMTADEKRDTAVAELRAFAREIRNRMSDMDVVAPHPRPLAYHHVEEQVRAAATALFDAADVIEEHQE